MRRSSVGLFIHGSRAATSLPSYKKEERDVGSVRPGVPTITDILLQAGVVGREQIAAALERQRVAGTRIGEALVELGSATEPDIGWALARQLGYTYVDLAPESLDLELLLTFSETLLRRLLAVPLVRSERSLSVAFGDPTDREALAEMERVAGLPIAPSVATPSSIRLALERLAAARLKAQGMSSAPALALVPPRAVASHEGSTFLAEHVRSALREGASEIHVLPKGNEVLVFHRVGRQLVSAGSRPASLTFDLLARLEALGGPAYDGAQPHAVGRALCPLGENAVALDISLLASEAGLAITLGLSEASAVAPDLDSLSIDPVDLACVRGVLDQPSGLVLVSGPSRAGCSTTLASLLAAVPVQGRRSIAFQDGGGTSLPSPTRISLPREQVRERWSEIVAAQAADVVALDNVFGAEHVAGVLATGATGRLVLATTDWSDSFALIEFLASRPGGAHVLAGRLRLVIQHRMACFDNENATSRMQPVFEVLCVSDPMRDALRSGAPANRLRELARTDHHRSLADRADALVRAGQLSPAEAARVAG
jgi:type II secretory ATPase GspE/PulE/Tfp pilus assembly ATPase PilB-like protein